MSISVIIPCHNGIEDTRGCLHSLQEQVEPILETLVIDNGSDDGTHRLAEEFAQVRVLRQGRNLGFAGGINQGLRAASGTLVMVLNNDTLVGAQMISRLKCGLETDPNIAITAPVSNYVKGSARIEAGNAGKTAAGRREIEAILDENFGSYLQDRCTLSGLCMMFRPALTAEIGLFDERFGSGNFEDDDFCLRARLQGHRLTIVRSAYVHHHGRRTFTAMGIDYYKSLDQHGQAFTNKWSNLAAGRAIAAQLDANHAIEAREARLAIEETPRWPDAYLILARRELDSGRYAEAAAHLSAFLHRCPNHGEAKLLRGCALIGAGRQAEGHALFAETIEKEPLCDDEHIAGLFYLARTLIQQGEAKDAIAHLKAILDFDPERAEALNLLGVACLANGEHRHAATNFVKAVHLGDKNAAGNLRLMAKSDFVSTIEPASPSPPPVPRLSLPRS